MTSRRVSISVIVASHNEGMYLRRTVDSLKASLPSDSEVIIVDDCSTDGSTDFLDAGYKGVIALQASKRLGTGGSRNFGASHARGEVIVFSDAHVEVSPGWVSPLTKAVTRPEVGVAGPVISDLRERGRKGYGLRFCDPALNCTWGEWQSADPYPVPLIGAGFMAMRRKLFNFMGGFDPGMILYGMEDPELDIRLWTFGYKLLLVPEVEVAHLFRSSHPYDSWETMLHNKLRLATIHFSTQRISRLVECIADDSNFSAAAARLATSDAWIRRKQIQAARRYDDDWFFRKFDMD